MINDKRGISVISVIVTIIVLVILTSITVFTGTKIIDNSRKKTADDMLDVIYNAILTHEKELGYTDTVPEKVITEQDYITMGLDNLVDNKNFNAVYVTKSAIDINNREYILKAQYKKNSDEWYKKNYPYTVEESNTSDKAEFDIYKGVNRPQFIDGMIAVSMRYDEDGDIRTKVIENIYTENWYDYSLETPRWANVLLENENVDGTKSQEYYVWIPRYAYKIQDFYSMQGYTEVPASAIDIIFLKGTSDYMANGEILPEGYIVHPAFSYGDEKYSGIWVSKFTSAAVDTIDEAVTKMSITGSNYNGHLMTNTEWAAMAYLSFACGNNSTDGSSNGNSYSIMQTNAMHVVAAWLGNDRERFNNYRYLTADKKSLTFDNGLVNGDATIETSSGDDNKSGWEKVTTTRPDNTNKYILRLGNESYFAYKSWSGSYNPATTDRDYPVCRRVITISE